MDKFTNAIEIINELKSITNKKDQFIIDSIFSNISCLQEKYEHRIELENKIIPDKIEKIILSHCQNQLDISNVIDSSDAGNIILDIGSYCESLSNVNLDRVTKLIMRNNFNFIKLSDMKSINAIDIVWNLHKVSKNKPLFDTTDFKREVDVTLEFTGTTALISGDSTITSDDVVRLEYFSSFATKETKHIISWEGSILKELGKCVTALDIGWYYSKIAGGELSARIVKYFPNLVWLDIGYQDDMREKDLLKLHKLETLIISGWHLWNLQNTIASLPRLTSLKWVMWYSEEEDVFRKPPPIEFIVKCKTLQRLFLCDPINWVDSEIYYEYKNKLSIACPDLQIIYHDEERME